MPGGLERLYLLAGATPCNWPSSGNALRELPDLPHPVARKRMEIANNEDRFFIFIKLKGIGQK